MRFFLRRRPGLWPVTAAILGTSFLAFAAVMDTFGPPPAGDPSAFTGPLVGETQAVDNLAALPPAHEGAFEGGPTGTHEDGVRREVLGPAAVVVRDRRAPRMDPGVVVDDGVVRGVVGEPGEPAGPAIGVEPSE